MPTASPLYVTYAIRPRIQSSASGASSQVPDNAVVDVPSGIPPREIPSYVRQEIRPAKAPEPSDGYRGQSPDEVVILNMIKLEDLQ